MTKKLLILSLICFYVSLLLGAVEARKVCSICKKSILKTDDCALRGGSQIHFRHAYDSLKKAEANDFESKYSKK